MTLDNIVDTLNPELIKNWLLVTHFIQNGNLVTRIADIETEEELESFFPMNATDPQKVGSEITYWKRYNLVALFNICADEDDDWNKASTSNDNHSQVSEPTEWINATSIDNLIKKIKSGEFVADSGESAVKLARMYYKVSKESAEAIKSLFSKEII